MALRCLLDRAVTVNSCLLQQFRSRSTKGSSLKDHVYNIPQPTGVHNHKKRQIELMMPSEEAGRRFWWKEDNTIWHWPPKKKSLRAYKYRHVGKYPVQVTDPERLSLLRKLIGPRAVYRDTPWFKHDCDYRPFKPEARVSRQFLGLSPSRKPK